MLEPVTPSQDLIEPAKPQPFTKTFLAILCSAIIPGSGQLLLRRQRTGFVLLTLMVIIIVGFWPLRLLRFYAGFLGLFGSLVVIYIFAALNPLFGSRNSSHPSRWWCLLVTPFVLVIVSVTGGALTRASGFRSFETPSTGMQNTIFRGDYIVVDTRYYRLYGPVMPDVMYLKKTAYFMSNV